MAACQLVVRPWSCIDRVGTDQYVYRHKGVEKNPFYFEPIHNVPILFAVSYLLNVLFRWINFEISILIMIYTHKHEIRGVK